MFQTLVAEPTLGAVEVDARPYARATSPLREKLYGARPDEDGSPMSQGFKCDEPGRIRHEDGSLTNDDLTAAARGWVVNLARDDYYPATQDSVMLQP